MLWVLLSAGLACRLFAGMAGAAPAAHAAQAAEEDEVQVKSSRISLADVMPGCPPRACAVDIGPAPPPGASFRIDGAVLRNALASAGEDPRAFGELSAVRVVSAARVLNPAEAADFVRPSIEQALPSGVTLAGVEAKSKLTLPLLGRAGTAVLPKLPRRAGPTTTTAMVDILLDGALVRRVPMLVRLVIGAAAARADVPRGHTLTLVIERGAATISTDGIALRDAEIGEVAPFKVKQTGRVINARVDSRGIAMVLEGD